MKKLFQAIRRGDAAAVRELLEKKPELIACTAKQPDFSTLLIRAEQIYDFNPGFQHFLGCRLLFKGRRFSVDWPVFYLFGRGNLVNRLA